MIKLTILYPNGPGSYFDMDYYLKTHLPMSRRLMGEALKGLGVDAGFAGGGEGVPAPYLVITTMLYDSLDAFMSAFLPHAAALQGDIANYTNAPAIVQFSEIVV